MKSTSIEELIPIRIGEKIKQLRLEHQMTLEDVADYLDVSRATVQRYESGVISGIPSDKIEKLSTLFGVSPGYLMGWVERDAIPYRIKSNDISETEINKPISFKAIYHIDESDINLSEGISKIISAYKNLPKDGQDYLLQQAMIANTIYGRKDEKKKQR